MVPTGASAAPIIGDLLTTGTVVVTVAGVIDFTPPCQQAYGPAAESCLPPLAVVPMSNYGEFNIESTSNGHFLSLGQPIEQDGRILDLNATDHPTTAPFVLPNFMTFAMTTNPDLNFTLTNVLPCSTAGPGSVCAFGDPNSAFAFIYDPDGNFTTVRLRLRGYVDDPGFDRSNWRGTFSANFGGTIAEAEARFLQQGYVESAYSSLIITSEAAVPEPATLLTFGAGTALLGAYRRRRNKKA